MFPFIVYYLRLRAARKAPFLCPVCDRAIALGFGGSDTAEMQKAG
jgi:hypothetical protein